MAALSNADKWVYGAALIVALIAAGIAAVANVDEDGAPTEEIDPVAAARERSEQEHPTGSIEFTTPAEPREETTETETPAQRDFMPNLPEVPDLQTEPPPPRPPTEEDPRLRSLGAEMRVLSRARMLLGQHPAEALGVIEQHHRQYPRGVLREEREAFAVEALLALEHSAEAERRYYDFLENFPLSDHREHLRQAMLRPPHRVGASGR